MIFSFSFNYIRPFGGYPQQIIIVKHRAVYRSRDYPYSARYFHKVES